ncbi:MAG: hypothetical protein ACLFTD_10985, partial [Halochromatium sp.]
TTHDSTWIRRERHGPRERGLLQNPTLAPFPLEQLPHPRPRRIDLETLQCLGNRLEGGGKRAIRQAGAQGREWCLGRAQVFVERAR